MFAHGTEGTDQWQDAGNPSNRFTQFASATMIRDTLLFLVPIAFVASTHASSTIDPISAVEQPCPNVDIVESDVWTVNTRCLPTPGCHPTTLNSPEYSHIRNGRWIPSSQEEFLADADPSRITCVFVHGNRMEPSDAHARGMKALRRFARGSTPVRFVIWSWPSNQVARRPVKDARIKANRADGESWYLAKFLSDLPANSMVSLIGFSFGARTVTGGVHRMSGLVSRTDDPDAEDGPRFRPRVILLAGAVPNHWILPNRYHGRVPYVADRIVSLHNPRDPALRFFHITDANGKPRALGANGVAARYFGANHAPLEQRDVSCIVGKSHSFDRYADSNWIANYVRRYALWEDTDSHHETH